MLRYIVIDIVENVSYGPFETQEAAEKWGRGYDERTHKGSEFGFGVFVCALYTPEVRVVS